MWCDRLAALWIVWASFGAGATVVLGEEATSRPAAERPVAGSAAEADEHPLAPVMRMAYAAYHRMDEGVQDYTCILTKRERVAGRLRGHESIFCKIRHEQRDNDTVVEPFGVYLRFLDPDSVKGREIVYVEGENHGKFIIRNGGNRFGFITTAFPPDSPAVLSESRYPIPDIGMKNLIQRLIEVGQREMECGDCEVKVLPGAKVDGRPSTFIQVSHPERKEGLRYHIARIFVDDQWQVPVRFSAYDWPKKEGDEPLLLEEYTYTDIKFNVGLTDMDFSHRNEAYSFRKDFEATPNPSTSSTASSSSSSADSSTKAETTD